MPRLVFSRGAQRLMDHRLRAGRTSIGRADSCDVALPGEALSRTHFFVEGQGERWELIDRSRHGVTVDDQPVRRVVLHDGAVIGFGDYTATFRQHDEDAPPPTVEALAEASYEQVLGAGEEGLLVSTATLVVVQGREEGRRILLDRSRISLGARGSGLVLSDEGLVPDHVRLRVSRGRVMLEPAAGAVFLGGERVREITPLLPGEEFRIGDVILGLELGERAEAPTAASFGEMVGVSQPMTRLFGTLRRVAAHHFPVLITGESGTGKELAARGIHDHSARAAGPFVAVNCGAIPEALFESELFGHERGAFTGAVRRSDGAFHRAHNGTLFLDEVGELPEAAQAKLLRALESGEVRRVGGEEVGHPDVRIVAATNRDLGLAVRQGRFREDLFFRLAVLSVHLPPLRARPEDLPALCAMICRGLRPDARVSEGAMRLLERHDWPGNVRELRNVLTRAWVLGGPVIEASSLSFHELPGPPQVQAVTEDPEAERAWLAQVLRRHGDNRSAAARELGIARTSLLYKMQKLGLT